MTKVFFMTTKDIYYQRNLPHYHLKGNPLFITFRLADSLPVEVLAQLKTHCELELAVLKNPTSELRYEIEQKYFELYDDWLGRCKDGPHWLRGDKIAHIVMKEIHNLDGSRYQLMAYCIMPNHVHLLIESLVHERANHRGRSATTQSPTHYVCSREELRVTATSNWNVKAVSGNMKVMIMLFLMKRNWNGLFSIF
jgi:hypothetical protein